MTKREKNKAKFQLKKLLPAESTFKTEEKTNKQGTHDKNKSLIFIRQATKRSILMYV